MRQIWRIDVVDPMVDETNRQKVVRRLGQDGWVSRGGGEHDVFVKPGVAFVIAVPRHRTLSVGVARDIAKKAGWR